MLAFRRALMRWPPLFPIVVFASLSLAIAEDCSPSSNRLAAPEHTPLSCRTPPSFPGVCGLPAPALQEESTGLAMAKQAFIMAA
jgi:hypothetical protein